MYLDELLPLDMRLFIADCLFNNLAQGNSKVKLCITGLWYVRVHRLLVDSPHNEPKIKITFLCHGIIMRTNQDMSAFFFDNLMRMSVLPTHI